MAQKKPDFYVEMADGTELNAEAGCGGRDLWIFFKDPRTTMQKALQICSNTAKTAKVIYHYPGGVFEWEGYTDVTTVRANDQGLVDVRLRRPQSAV